MIGCRGGRRRHSRRLPRNGNFRTGTKSVRDSKSQGSTPSASPCPARA
ncbi:hypothetical protein PLANPX_0270 [Lacipirellula parvula]|uniref:Uncharacterized protein n=1 Tax=Lacipirellula parvula TaxID=2650471 RepID=A0A5K7X1X6_9BACT|nr:hypothetical protein PLANPX_0270 [Lacipirellula parvula]